MSEFAGVGENIDRDIREEQSQVEAGTHGRCDGLLMEEDCRRQGREEPVHGNLVAGLAGRQRGCGPTWTACLSFDSA